MNKVMLAGNLSSDADAVVTREGLVVRLTVVTNRGKNASFIDCVIKDELAIANENKLKRGMKVFIEGYLATYKKSEKEPRKLEVCITRIEY